MKISLDGSFFLSGVHRNLLSFCQVLFQHFLLSVKFHIRASSLQNILWNFLCQYSLSNLFLFVKFPLKNCLLFVRPSSDVSFFLMASLSDLPHFFKFLSEIFLFVLCFPWNENVSHSVVSNSETSLTVAYQVPLSMEFFRQEYWSGWPFLSPGDLLDSGIETVTHIAGSFFIIWATREAHVSLSKYLYFWQNFLIIALLLLGFLLIRPFFQNSFRNHLLLSEFPSKITFFLFGFPLI